MLKLFFLSTKIHAFFAESGMLILALACIAGAIALLSLNIPFIGWAKKGLAYTLFAVAIFVFGHLEGYRARATLDASADLQRQIAQQQADLEERQRQADQARELAAAAGVREREASDQSQSLAEQVQAYETELAKRSGNDLCVLSDADLRFLRGIGTAPKPRGH
jgi:Skp family chaperone for outer membrane proteins